MGSGIRGKMTSNMGIEGVGWEGGLWKKELNSRQKEHKSGN